MAYFVAAQSYWDMWVGDATRTSWDPQQSSNGSAQNDGQQWSIWNGTGASSMQGWGRKPISEQWLPKPGYGDYEEDRSAPPNGSSLRDRGDKAAYSEYSDYSSGSSTPSWNFLSEEPRGISLVNSNTSGACASLCREAETADVVGIDAEWVPDWTLASDNPISVLQLAFPQSGRAYVVQLGTLGRQLPQAVQLMLLNPEVTKVGFGCSHQDAAKFERSGIVVTKGSMVDVQSRCAALLGVGEVAGRSLSLKRASLELLGFVMEKDKKHTCSDWSVETLSAEQVRYAALDAWVALRLYYRTA
mmetsp:Transcript_13175/g.28832  ORF Transcript_13175/g.28832 Transcript_13175/m.28832 type:complete len:301 (+) Transcript_13175:474-1376(+)|eukprot:CAMPEP_0206495382 /NCGR_PEP_ID=MMETSP0324_2-20121206/48496_1 /ASSEMBLY_ACC=CAM_ASM_000836 /TAXON_ID=2866 /ORGANISM="Crypthecodinium cohnii, Strain Seligo" /LENGTH=300 /DNA_ID=CAMNT_0053979629 /DNA_START=409 /DNA_END=1311 /DNA_ORIENTATION=-